MPLAKREGSSATAGPNATPGVPVGVQAVPFAGQDARHKCGDGPIGA